MKAQAALMKAKQSPYYKGLDEVYLNESSVFSQSNRQTLRTLGHSPFRQSVLSMSLSRSPSEQRSSCNNPRDYHKSVSFTERTRINYDPVKSSPLRRNKASTSRSPRASLRAVV